jgi:hypothetical protein
MRNNSFGLIGRRRLLGLAGAAAVTFFAAGNPNAVAGPSRLGTSARDRHWNRQAARIRAGHEELLAGYANAANGGRS